MAESERIDNLEKEVVRLKEMIKENKPLISYEGDIVCCNGVVLCKNCVCLNCYEKYKDSKYRDRTYVCKKCNGYFCFDCSKVTKRIDYHHYIGHVLHCPHCDEYYGEINEW